MTHTASDPQITHSRVPLAAAGEALHVALLRPRAVSAESHSSGVVVVFVHGFVTTGVENAGLFMRAARRVVESGWSALLVDQRGCGYSTGDYTDFTVTQAVEDIIQVVRWVELELQSTVVLWGQSLGSAVSVLTAAKRSSIKGLVLWNLSADMPSRYRDVFPNASMESDWCVEHKGFVVGSGFLTDAANYDVVGAATAISAPLMLLSSGADQIGNHLYADQVVAQRPDFRQRVFIEGASHSFTCQPMLEDAAISASVDWIDRTIRGVGEAGSDGPL